MWFRIVNEPTLSFIFSQRPGGSENLPPRWETQVPSLGWENPLEKGRAIYSSIVVWKIPWTEDPGRLQSLGSQTVEQD